MILNSNWNYFYKYKKIEENMHIMRREIEYIKITLMEYLDKNNNV